MEKFSYGDIVMSPRLWGFFKVGYYDKNNDGFVWIGGYQQKSILIHQDDLVSIDEAESVGFNPRLLEK